MSEHREVPFSTSWAWVKSPWHPSGRRCLGCSRVFLWVTSSQVVIWRLINYESLFLTSSYNLSEPISINLCSVAYCPSCFLCVSCLLTSVVHLDSSPTSSLSAQKSRLYLLPIYWLFSSLLNQSQQYIFTVYKDPTTQDCGTLPPPSGYMLPCSPLK